VGQRRCTSFHFQVLYPASSPRYIDPVKTNLLATAARPTESTCFRLYLQAELGRRCARNPQYSLRAFAKYLASDHATISQLLRGRRPFTARTIVRLGTRLGLDRASIDGYVSHEPSWSHEAVPATTFGNVQQLADDAANVISDWYHYAILELTRLRDFQPDTRWIARVLGISPDEVNLALSRLTRLGLLEMADRNQWIDKSGDTAANLSQFSEAAVRYLFERVRQVMLAGLGSLPTGRYEHSSTTLALCTHQVPKILERIANFRRELHALLEQNPAPDDVYQLEINFFPITSLHRNEENTDGTTGNAMANPGQGTG
jgi:hypothetical protein